MKLSKLLLVMPLAMLCSSLRSAPDARVFELLNLQAPGLEKVAAQYGAGNVEQAAGELLIYYKGRTAVVHPDIDATKVTITAEEQKWADEGMRHIFFVHYGYQPSFFYGDDIDWMHWPVKDNELRWQLHRTKWWVPMGKAYRASGDENYAREWMAQYLDWMEKNPLIVAGGYERADVSSGEINHSETTDSHQALIENVCFAWRPLEVSDRLEFQIHQFAYFIAAESFSADFLTHFLVNYHRHATHITQNFSESGNHLLFEAQRLTFAGVYFPEFKDAALWRKAGVEILNREIGKQVYPDGMQYELDPHYHLEAVNIFFNALRMMDANGYRGEFPQSYLDLVEKMMALNYNISFPDYTNPIFSDAKLHDIDYTLPYYKKWTEVYPENQMIRWMATEGVEGAPEPYLSRAFKTSGYYVLRNGWDKDATVMVLKAGPPAFWHNQPDNGTFELWRKGRNFFPDSGSYVYAGDKEIMELRNWFRQTRVHNTLTLDNRDLTGMNSKCVYWSTGGTTDVLVYENPSYEGLTHRRSVYFVDREFYVIVDEAMGDASGEVEIHYNLVEDEQSKGWDRYMDVDSKLRSVETKFDDGNNIKMQVFGAQDVSMAMENGWMSRAYRHRVKRPLFTFASDKTAGQTVRFITVIAPVDVAGDAKISASFAKKGVEVKIGKKKYNLSTNLNNKP